MKKVPVVGGKFFIIDDCLYDKVRDYTFYTGVCKNKGKEYAYIYTFLSKSPLRKITLRKLLFGDRSRFLYYLNGDVFDNRLCNITDVNLEKFKQQANRKGNESKYVGVNKVVRKKVVRWEALVLKKRKEHSIMFDSEVKAAIAANIMFRELFNIDYDVNSIPKNDFSKYYNDVISMIKMDLNKRRSLQRQGLKIKSSGATSKYVGVHLRKNGVYAAKITKAGVAYRLGFFDNEVDAAHAYDEKAIEFFGDKAKTNF